LALMTCLLEAAHAVASAKAAGVEGFVGLAIVVDGEDGAHHARRVARSDHQVERRVSQGELVAVMDDAVALGCTRCGSAIAARTRCGLLDQLPILFAA
jgi:hypothetical protein